MDCHRKTKAELIAEIAALQERIALLSEQPGFQAVMDYASVGFVISQKGLICSVNSAALHIFGYGGLGEVQGQPISQFIAPDYQAIMVELNHLREEGHKFPHQSEIMGLRRDGTLFPLLIDATRFEYRGQPAILVFVTDLSEQKMVEQRLSEALNLNQKIIAASAVGILVYQASGACLLANEAAAGILAATVPQLLNQNYQTFGSWKDSGLVSLVQDALRTGDPKRADVHFVSTFGREVWLEANVIPFDSDREAHVVVMINDVTARRMAEQALQESEKRYRLLAEHAQDLIFRVRFLPDRKLEYISPSALDITGYPPEEHYADPDLIFKMIHPGDLPFFFEYISSEEPIRSGTPITLRWVRKDGTVIYLEHKNVPVYDETGAVVAMESIARDVTQRNKTEAQLVYQANLLANVNDAIIAWDQNFILTAWNHTAEVVFGWSADEVIGRPLDEFLHVDFFGVEHPDIRAQLHKEGSFSGEVIIYRKDGLPVFIENKSIALYDDQGNRIGYASVNRDITRRKQEEVEIRQQNLYIQLLQEVAVAANEAAELNPALAFVLDRVCEYTGWPIGHVYLPSKGDPQLLEPSGIWHLAQPEAYANFKRITEATTFRSGVGLPGLAYASEKAVWEPDASRNPAFLRGKKAVDLQVRTGLAFPILVGKKAVGVLEFFTEAILPRDEALERVMLQIGTLVGRVIERIESQRALESRERHFRALIEHNAGVIALVAADGTILYESPSVEQVLGFPAAEVVNKSVLDRIHPDDSQIAQSLFTRVLEMPGASLSHPFRVLHQDGSWRWLDVVASNLLEEPAVQAVVLNYSDITDRKQREDMLSFLSTHDTLTGLYNRAYLAEQMEQIQRQGLSPVMVVAGDMDNLKKVNDECGHEAGDRLIQRTAHVLQTVFRKQDVIARMGGDEFIVLLPNASPSLPEIIRIRIEKALAADNAAHPEEPLSLSIGIAISQAGELLRETIQRADQSMYAEKAAHHTRQNE